MTYSYKADKSGKLHLLNDGKEVISMNFETTEDAIIWADNWETIWNANIAEDADNTFEKSILPQDEA
jgi:hypothetical protein